MSSARCNIRRVRSTERTAALDLVVPAQRCVKTPRVAGDFTAWVPVPMELGSDGDFRMRVVLPRNTEFRFAVLEGDDPFDHPGADLWQLSCVTV